MALLYHSESRVRCEAAGHCVELPTSLTRPGVSLRARLLQPLAFRDCMLAVRECILSRLYIPPEEIIAAQLDPVVTVSPAGVFFEAFSQDESSYARFAVRPGALDGLSETAYGCTNIAFSEGLARGLRELRSTSDAYLEVGREGVALQAQGVDQHEPRIELPASWVQGFVEVQAAQSLPGVWLDCAPRDLLNLLNYLRKRKAKVSPRSLRIVLEPGKPPKVTVEPWNEVMEFRGSRHACTEVREFRVWGRRRLLVLASTLALARKVRVLLQGSAAPSFWIVELQHMSLVLGLSPWSAREWTVAEAVTGLTVPFSVDAQTIGRVLSLVEERLTISAEELAATLQLAPPQVDAALRALCYRGRLFFDLEQQLYVARKLFDRDPEDPPGLSRRQAEARQMADGGKVQLGAKPGGWHEGSVRGKGANYQIRVQLNEAGELREGACTCPFFARFGASRGPCKHLLAAGLSLQ